MKQFQGKIIVDGAARASAVVTKQPINFTAAMCKPHNLLPGRKAEIRDEHHELMGVDTRDKIIVFPSCIGSTHTGLVLLELVSQDVGPAGLIVGSADSLLVSGVVLADVWFDKSIPIIECDDESLFDTVTSESYIEIEAGSGLITVTQA